MSITLGVLASCSAPTMTLLVDHRSGVTKVQLRQRERLVVEREYPVPITDCGFSRVDGGEESGEIWRVVAFSPGSDAEVLRYGAVPPGFVQVTPTGGAPPPLRRGGRYRVECSGEVSALGASTDFRIPR